MAQIPNFQVFCQGKANPGAVADCLGWDAEPSSSAWLVLKSEESLSLE